MAGTKLHRFDVSLCGHALGVIRGYMVRPDFVEYVTEQPTLACSLISRLLTVMPGEAPDSTA